MAVRKVEIRLSDPGFETVARHLDELSAKLDKIKAKFDELSKKVSTPRVEVKGIDEDLAKLDLLSAKLDEIGHKSVTADVRVNKSGGAFSKSIADVMREDKKAAEDILRRGGGGGGGFFSRLFGAGAAGGGGTASGLLSSLGGANNQYTGGLIGGLIALAGLVAPSVIPFGLGGIVGGGAAAGAFGLGNKEHQLLLQLQQRLTTGKGSAAANAPILAQMARIRQRYRPELQVYGSVSNLGHTAVGVFNDALTSMSKGFSPNHPGSSFLGGLSAILQQIGGFLKTIGPGLGQLFRASLPSLTAFVKIMEQFAKAVMPAVTQVLNQLTRSGALPILVKGFALLADDIAGFIKNLGPGVKDSAIIFQATMRVVGDALRAIGSAATGFAIMVVDVARGVKKGWHEVAVWTDELRHNAPSYFRQMGHDLMQIWNDIYNNTIGIVIRMVNGVSNWDSTLRHGIANVYDDIRHFISSAWDSIWQYTLGSVRKGVAAVVSYFRNLPGSILAALRGLGHSLYAFGHAALTDLWDGMKAVGGSLIGWAIGFVKSLPGKLLSALHMSPPHPGSAFFDLGSSIMHHFEAGVQARAHRVAAAIHGAVGGPSGGSAAAAAAYGRRLAAAYGWGGQWGSINAVAMRESGWSMTARNPSSGAYGIAQFINGPSEYYQYGGNPSTIAGQVTAFYNYIRQRYGSPNAAWAHELNYGWYDRGGRLKQGLTLALNTSGQDEYITKTPGGGGGNIYINVTGDFANPDATALRVVQAIRKYKIHHGNAPLGIA